MPNIYGKPALPVVVSCQWAVIPAPTSVFPEPINPVILAQSLFEVMRDFPAYLKQRGQVDFETLIRAVISLDVKAVLQAAMTNAIPEELIKQQ